MPKVTRETRRCAVCKLRVTLDHFTCRCNTSLVFCSTHRFPFEHKCTLELCKEHQSRLSKLNPTVLPQKLQENV